MSPKISDSERKTQNRLIDFFQSSLGYRYLGNWEKRNNNQNIETEILIQWLQKQKKYDPALITKALRQLDQANVIEGGRSLYQANMDIYNLLRYGVKEKAEIGEHYQTVWLIDWDNIQNNDFAIAEEVTIKGEHTKRPDIVLYLNGIAVGIIELKRSSVAISEGIRQNLDNQTSNFIKPFFTTIQLLMAGNDTVGMKYGTIETPENHYLEWKEEGDIANSFDTNILDKHLYQLCHKDRLIELIHDFLIFDHGRKKTCRHSQYFGVKAAQEYVKRKEGGIVWHTQGSGKSLTMVWLAKWIREHEANARVLIITDRTELDDQIEKVFFGVNEEIYRTQSGTDLIDNLNRPNPWLLCSLIHKFGANVDEYMYELQSCEYKDFCAKGNIFVFVDECHRTQSGILHKAMKALLPDAVFFGFTGTPLLKADKQNSLDVFGPFIHTYKFNEAVKDKVTLDLRYEARDIDQKINQSSYQKIDQWFENKTRNMTDFAKNRLKQKWGSLSKLYSSKDRLQQIVNDIVFDMEDKPRLADGRGNALLVCNSIYEACSIYQLFQDSPLKGHCAIITSYQPTANQIKGEATGEGLTEALLKYDVYRQMIADFFDIDQQDALSKCSDFEEKVKDQFIQHPAQMRLLIVVDKLLTGFDAPSATYLYIDKPMQDHQLFQAICRVNRLDQDKDYGYIVDYRDLFKSLENAIHDYTSNAFEQYEKADVDGLLKDRLVEAKKDLDDTLEDIRALCENVAEPKSFECYQHYFVGHTTQEINQKEPLRIALYKQTSKLVSVFLNIASEIDEVGYKEQQIIKIREEVKFYQDLKMQIQQSSGDYLDMKTLEPTMRYLFNTYVKADSSTEINQLNEFGLINLIVEQGEQAVSTISEAMGGGEQAVSESIENNIRKILVDKNPINPKYYQNMSILLDELVALRRQKAIEYQEYLKQIVSLTKKVMRPEEVNDHYPSSIQTIAQKALYDNFGQHEKLVNKIDNIVITVKKADWRGNRQKENQIKQALDSVLSGTHIEVEDVFNLIKEQSDY